MGTSCDRMGKKWWKGGQVERYGMLQRVKERYKLIFKPASWNLTIWLCEQVDIK